MSWWTYVKGFVEVRPFGRTQAEERYIALAFSILNSL